jgi:hypothetical protein
MFIKKNTKDYKHFSNYTIKATEIIIKPHEN